MSAPVPVHDGLFTDTVPPRLRGGRCRACSQHHFPPAEVCPYCSSDETEPADLSGDGRLWAWTAVTHPPPGYQGEVPYGFGVVELPEGIRVITRLTEADPAQLRMGQPMHLVVDLLHVDDDGRRVVTYAFAADEVDRATSASQDGSR